VPINSIDQELQLSPTLSFESRKVKKVEKLKSEIIDLNALINELK
jgi:hypothetical protein